MIHEAHSPATILLVDDEVAIVHALASELRYQNHSVFIAHSGMKALELLHVQEFDILITDLNMPGMNGLELLSKAIGIQTEIQVIVLTGFGGTESAVEALNRGASGYLFKPPDLKELTIHIAQCYKKLALTRALRQKNVELEAEVAMRAQAELDLTQAKNTTDAILAAMVDALMVISTQGIILQVNHSVCRMLSWEEYELVGKAAGQLLLHKDERSPFLPEGASALFSKDGTIDNTEAILVARDGREIPVLVSGSVMWNDHATQATILLVARDITDYQRTQKSLREKEAQLIHSGRLTAMGEMASGIAHELNQPLTIIRMAAQNFGYRLAAGIQDKINPTEFSNKIIQQVDRAATIINHMRSFVRGEPTIKEAILMDPRAAALDSLTFFQEQFRVQEISLILDISESLPMISMPANHFEQILINLLSNARYAVNKKKGGDDHYVKEVNLRLFFKEEETGFVVLEVKDNGIGMTSDEQQRCWEPFFSTKGVGEGTGLGLYIVHSIAKEQRVEIQLESVSGEGTCFRVSFPAVMTT